MYTLYKKNVTSTISTIIIFVFFIAFMIIKHVEPFGNNSFIVHDGQGLIYPFLVSLRNKLIQGDGLYYYWNGGLGDGFLPSYFFTIASPLYFAVVLVDYSHITDFLNITIVVRIILSAWTFGIYISRNNGNITNKAFMIPLTCAYSLSGFILGYYSECMWLDSYVLFPLIMYGYKKIMQENKTHIYIIGLVICAFCNFFMTYMIGLFLVLYFFTDSSEYNIPFFSRLKSFIFSSLIAIGMSSIPIIISLFAILDTRVGTATELHHEWNGNIIDLLKNHFFLTTPIVISYRNDLANIYCGVFSVFIVSLYFIISKDSPKNKIKRLILLSFLFISMNESILGYIWHGFHFQSGVPNRFSFIYIFILLDTCTYVFTHETKTKLSIFCFLIIAIIPIVTYYMFDFASLINNNLAFIINESLILLYFLLYNLYIKKPKSEIILTFIMILEIITNASFSLSNTIENDSNNHPVLESIYQTNHNISSKNNNDFYRSRILGHDMNGALLTDLNGVELFNGFLNTNTEMFLENMGYFCTETCITDKGGGSPIDEMLSIKNNYFINNKSSVNDFCVYPITYDANNYSVKTNPYALSLGYGIYSNDPLPSFETYKYFNNINKLVENISGYTNILEELYPSYDISGEGFGVEISDTKYINMTLDPIVDYPNHSINSSFIVDETGSYYVSVAYQAPGRITVTVNDNIRQAEDFQEGGIIPIGMINEGDKVNISISYSSVKTEGIPIPDTQLLEIHLAKLNQACYNNFINQISQNQLSVNKLSDHHFVGKITLSESQKLFTSIPYDDGWHIYENGQELKKDKFANAFIMLDIGTGEHELEFKYIPKGLYLSIVLSLLSWITWILSIKLKEGRK